MGIIGLRPLGSIDEKLLSKLVEPIHLAFGQGVRIDAALPEIERSWHNQRQQYLALTILEELSRVRPPDEERTLGIMEKDLYIPELNFVFGMADPKANVAVISLARLHPEFYRQAPNELLFVERAIKEALHELGHTYGLRHCPDPTCVMHFSNTIKDTDRKQARFCGKCGISDQSSVINF